MSIERDWALIVGLGNPGREYASHRHNAGFQCLDRFAQTFGLRFDRLQNRALLAHGTVANRRVILAKPQTFMNLSGEAVAPLARFYRIAEGDILVIYDDLDLPLGTLRLRPGGGSGGHKGVQSIIDHLGTQQFPRLRLGIGRPPGNTDAADYVLQPFTEDERAIMEITYQEAVDAIRCWLEHDIEIAMTRYNKRRETPPQ